MKSTALCSLGFGLVCAWLWAGVSEAAAPGPARYLKEPNDWFKSDSARQIATNILSYQSDLGGWPKNLDTTTNQFHGDRERDLKPTFDNGATTDELRFLARFHTVTHDDTARAAFLRGLDHILVAQYPTGGWPQSYPPDRSYHRHITFNDHAMERLLRFLREVDTAPTCAWVDPERKARARRAFEAGIQCILRCQIKVDGRLTAWCAQHDERDDSPRPGRTFELASISGAESVGLVRLLMSLESPSPEVIAAIDGAVNWFRGAALHGIRVDLVPDPQAPKGKDKRVVADPSAPRLWARFYDIRSNRPIYADRDGVARTNLSELGYERRNGYAWLGDWPQSLLDKDYPAWVKQQPGRKAGVQP